MNSRLYKAIKIKPRSTAPRAIPGRGLLQIGKFLDRAGDSPNHRFVASQGGHSPALLLRSWRGHVSQFAEAHGQAIRFAASWLNTSTRKGKPKKMKLNDNKIENFEVPKSIKSTKLKAMKMCDTKILLSQLLYLLIIPIRFDA